tara:strand:+ start:3604 stop:4725 length:1122 start_codon:yes stop_codon:yes gene_type:complete
MSNFSAFKPHKTKHCCVKNEDNINDLGKKMKKLEKKIKVLEENNLEDDFEDTYDKLQPLENKKLERKGSPTSVEEIFDESKEFMGGRKIKNKSRKKRGGFMAWMGLTADFVKNNFDLVVERGTKIKMKVKEEERDIILHKDTDENGSTINYIDTDGHYFLYADPEIHQPINEVEIIDLEDYNPGEIKINISKPQRGSGVKKRKSKKGGTRTVRREPKSNNNINQRLVDEYISELRNRNPRRRASPYYPEEISDELRNRLINENGYYRGVVHNSGVMADEMVYEYMNYPCYTPCKKQGVCDRVFGCGPDKCRPADPRAIEPDSITWRRCVKPSTRRRGGKSKNKKRKTKKRKMKKRKTKKRKLKKRKKRTFKHK